jgi:hypothetical protein
MLQGVGYFWVLTVERGVAFSVEGGVTLGT